MLRSDDQRLMVAHFIGQASELYGVAGGQRARALDGVLKFSDVAWPGVSQNLLEGVRRVPRD